MTTILEKILKARQDWKIDTNNGLSKAVAAYEQLDAAFNNFIGPMTDCYPMEQQDKQAQGVLDAWFAFDDAVEKKLVYLIASQAAGIEAKGEAEHAGD
jgi:hypothetical protein